MGFLTRLEQLIGGQLEGLSRRLFGARVTPRMVARAVEDAVVLRPGPDGRDVATNQVLVRLGDDDLAALAEQLSGTRREAEQRIRRLVTARGWDLAGRPRVVLENTADLARGELTVTAEVIPGPGAAELVRVGGGERYHLDAAAVVLGREPGCDIRLDADGISRRHARFEPRGDHWAVVDLGSTNGTAVNGTRVAMRPLRHGNIVGLGTVRLEFREL